VTMQSFLFISSHEKLRKLLLEKATVSSLVHLGPRAFQSISGEIVNTVMFAMEKGKQKVPSSFHDVKDIDHDEKVQMVWETLRGRVPRRSHSLFQSEFHKIPGSPFVYQVSDKIRGLFGKLKPLEQYANVVQGLATADNDRFLRFWWEVKTEDISVEYKRDGKKWVPYAKGGPYNKWYGNLWWVVNWEKDGREIKNFVDSSGKQKSRPQNESYYFKEGLTYTLTTSSGPTYRKLPINQIFDVKGSAIFPKEKSDSFLLPILTSQLFSYLSSSIRPNIDFSVGDLKTIPVPNFSSFDNKTIDRNQLSNTLGKLALRSPYPDSRAVATDPTALSDIAEDCIAIKKALYAFHIMERDFRHDPLTWALSKLREEGKPLNVTDALKTFFRYKAEQEARLLVNEALNDELVFKLYGLLPDEMTLTDALARLGLLNGFEKEPCAETENAELSAVQEVLGSEGVPVGAYPSRTLSDEERNALERLYLNHRHDRGSDKSEAISGMDFGIVEELSAAFKVSPITVVQEIALIEELPPEAAKDALSEHIQALAIDILRKDPDGILSLGADTGESSLRDRIIEQWRAMGIGQSYHELENLLGKRLEAYLLKDFFKDHSKRFQNRPILWHLVSDEGNVNFFILHHAWTYDRLLLLKSNI